MLPLFAYLSIDLYLGGEVTVTLINVQSVMAPNLK